MINIKNIMDNIIEFSNRDPFDHCIVDGFFEPDIAARLAREFPDYDSPDWFFYRNVIEHKKALNNWEKFPNLTYRAFHFFSRPL